MVMMIQNSQNQKLKHPRKFFIGIEVEGWTSEKDDLYTSEQLALAGATYAIPTFCRDDYGGYVYSTDVPIMFPFSPEWWKPTPDDRIRELAKAGALIAAEIDRLQRIK